MGEKGKAAVFMGPGKGYEIQEFDVPDPDADGIVIKISLGGVCGSDLHIWRGDSAMFAMMAGNVIGHEMTGRVYKLGSNITTDSLGRPLKEGDRVCYAYFYPCNRCYQCVRGEHAACAQKVMRMIGGPEQVHGRVRASITTCSPDTGSTRCRTSSRDEMVAPVNCALSQVVYGLNQAGLRFGDTLVVQGAGGLGTNACAVAKEMGADQVIVIDGMPGRLELAKKFGADQTIDINEFPDAGRARGEGDGADGRPRRRRRGRVRRLRVGRAGRRCDGRGRAARTWRLATSRWARRSSSTRRRWSGARSASWAC